MEIEEESGRFEQSCVYHSVMRNKTSSEGLTLDVMFPGEHVCLRDTES